MVRTRRRKILIVLGAIFVALVLIVAAFPLWFPWLLGPVAARHGVEYNAYERVGYGRMALESVRYSREGTRFEAERIEAPTPLAWLWKRYVGRRGERTRVEISGWRLALEPSGEPGEPRPPYEIAEAIEEQLMRMDSWLPEVAAERGAVEFSGHRFLVSELHWSDGMLAGSLSWPERQQNARLEADLRGGFPFEASAVIEPQGIRLIARAAREDGLFRLSGTGSWMENEVLIEAEFSPSDTLPGTASLVSESFRVPADLLNLRGYDDLSGAFEVRWAEEQFSVELTAAAQPAEEFLFPAEVLLRARGGTSQVLIDTATITLPWLELEVSEGAAFDFSGRMLTETAAARIAVNLDEQPWFALEGRLQGEVRAQRTDRLYPDITVEAGGDDIVGFGIYSPRLEIEALLEWPLLRLHRADFLVENGGGNATLDVDLNARTAEGAFSARGNLGNAWLPHGVSYQTLEASGRITGPLNRLRHAGSVTVHQLILPATQPLDVSFQWEAERTDFERIEGLIAGPQETSIAFSGAARFSGESAQIRVTRLEFAGEAGPLLSLEQPFEIRRASLNAADGAEPASRIEMEPFLWSGPGGVVASEGMFLEPMRRGKVSLEAKRIRASAFQPLTTTTLPPAVVDHAAVSADWSDGPARFAVTLLGSFLPIEGVEVSVALKAHGDESGMRIDRLAAGTHEESVLAGQGFLPATLDFTGETHLHFDEEREIDFQAVTEPHVEFWRQMEEWVGVRAIRPQATIAVSGTLRHPQGKLVISVDQLEWPGAGRTLPSVQEFRADIDLVREAAVLNEFTLRVEGQRVEARGRVPANFARDWPNFLDWDNADADLLADANISALARFYPEILSPQGRVFMEVALRPGGRVDGHLRLDGAATRPVLPMGPIHDVAARLRFVHREIRIETFSGLLGGQRVEVTGGFRLDERGPDGLPLMHIEVRGENVPLVRQPELILRSDLNVTVSNRDRDVPLISGTLNLRESVFLMDFRPFVPGRVMQPSRRPPFFSIGVEPFASWRLDLDVRGTEFLSVRTPFFRGTISAVFDLEGTLREPYAIGEANVPSGLIRFPFANLNVEQGVVSLTSQNPYRPELFFMAESRTFGYDIRMDVTGYADAPIIEFSSTPALSSEEIVLMVAAGQVPRENFAFSSEQRAARLAVFLGRDLLNRLGFGEDGEERLMFRAGEQISDQGKQTYQLEYRLDDRWSLVGEYDRFGEFNAGVKWRVYSR